MRSDGIVNKKQQDWQQRQCGRANNRQAMVTARTLFIHFQFRIGIWTAVLQQRQRLPRLLPLSGVQVPEGIITGRWRTENF